MTLIVVESPTKARTFNRILKGKDYFVFATLGHIRDLPSNKIAIDYQKQFKPQYVIIKNKTKVVAKLKELAKENKEIILATDPDREGESISYHVAYILGFIRERWPEIGFKDEFAPKRIVFHEITSRALQEALEKPETLRLNLVKAQMARRILDRVVGYELSPLLWKKMGKNWLSAGRVQTVALRIIVEREKEIRKFKVEDYFQIYGQFDDNLKIRAILVSHNDIPYEIKNTIQLFAGEYTYTKTTIAKDNIDELKADLQKDTYKISKIDDEVEKRYPPPPLTTSLMQQDAFRRYGFSSKMTMMLAQNLYERGFITYHRTDSFNLSTHFVFAAKAFIETTYGKEYALERPRGYHTKSKMAQEAHEAIRPTKLERDVKKTKGLTINHKRLYELIFDRAVSCQMKEAEVRVMKVHIRGERGYEFISEYQQVVFPGFLKVLNPNFVEKNKSAPEFKLDSLMKLLALEDILNQTKPPWRYNEASLIRILEEKGIGRPSTYAPIISHIQEKNYVEKDGRYFIPTKLGEAISDYLSQSFPNIFDLDFTVSMEQGLDDIADNNKDFIKLLTDFNGPFQEKLKKSQESTEIIKVEDEITETCPRCGSKLVVKYSRFGKFLGCSGYPDCKFTKAILKIVKGQKCPLDGGDVVIKFSKSRKRFYGCSNYPNCKWSSWKLNFKKPDEKS